MPGLVPSARPCAGIRSEGLRYGPASHDVGPGTQVFEVKPDYDLNLMQPAQTL